MQDILIESIRTDDGVQSRAAINQEYVAELVELLKSGKKLPPVEVCRADDETWMADGFHRLLAHQEANKRTIRAEIHKGGRKEARMHSAGANFAHGLRRRSEDKRKAVSMVLEDRPEMSDQAIADHCGVSVSLVVSVRRSTPMNMGVGTRVGTDGITRRIPPPPPLTTPMKIEVGTRVGTDGITRRIPPPPPRNYPPPPPLTTTRTFPPPPSGNEIPPTPRGSPRGSPLDGPKDAVGETIPDHLRPLFSRGAEVQALLGQISSVKGVLKRAEETGDILYGDCRFQQALAALETAYDTIKATNPYVVCPWCKGVMSDNCRGCGKRGVLGKYRYSTVPRGSEKVILRDYQQRAVAAVESEWREHKSTLIVLPTGTGKTITFAEIIRRAFPRRALILAHREELIFQARDKVHQMTGWNVAIEMGDTRADMSCMFGGPRVVVSTIQTQASGGDGGGRMSRFDPRIFGVIVVDEGHHAPAASYRRVLDWYSAGNPDLRILGVTATPDRADEEALGQVFETVAYDYEVLDAITDGWLVPIFQQLVSVEGLDFSQCRTTAGDLNGADLAAVMEYEENLHRVVSPSIEIVGGRRTLVFAASVDHAERMCELFNRHRSNMAAWVCGKTPKDDRRRILADFASGKVQVVCNCGVLTEGFDNPGVEVVIMARPTKSRSLYAQMAGRATRPADAIAHDLNNHESPEARRALIEVSGKPFALIVDFVGNSGRHKLCTSADILGGNISADVRDIAVAQAKTGKPVRMDEALVWAAEQDRKAKERESARRARLTANAKWSAKNINPFDVLDVAPVQERGWDKGKRLSEKQTAILKGQGIDPSALPYRQARQLLDEIFRRWDGNLCTFPQAKTLRKHGMPTNITRTEASRIITEIATKEGWKRDKNKVA